MKGFQLRGLVVFCCVSAVAQERPAPKSSEFELPLPITSPRGVQPGAIEPLTPKQKVDRAIQNIFSPRAALNRALLAGIDHIQNEEYEWPGGAKGYSMHFGNRMGRLAVRNAVQLSTDLAFGIDPRYDRCDCTGFLPRTGHAWRRVVVARKDNGGETFAFSQFAGAYVPPIITDQWGPDRLNTWNEKISSGSSFLVLRGATNMLREFWPEISRKLRVKWFKSK